MGEIYVLITNRSDLSAYEVIMLYAYRWQIELCFRFMKSALTAIHLMTHSPEGIQIQFYFRKERNDFCKCNKRAVMSCKIKLNFK